MARLSKIPHVTEDQWNSINKENKKMVEEFLLESIQLSPQTLKQYKSGLRIFFYWVKENREDKCFHEIKPKDFLIYQNHLLRFGLSSSAVRFKRASISSFNIYIETYYQEEYPLFRNFITRGIAAPVQSYNNKKEPLTLEEYDDLCAKLKKKKKWQKLAYLKFSFSSGARREEVRQLLKEVASYEQNIKEVDVRNKNGDMEKRISRYYTTHKLRAKGQGKVGKIRTFQFGEDVMESIKKWMKIRGDDNCPHLFVSRYGGEIKQVTSETFNSWCNSFESIVGRRVHPHMLRVSRASSLVNEQGVDIKSVQKLLGHNNSSTTEIYIIRDDEDASDEVFI